MPFPRPAWTCPHCHKRDRPATCRVCEREMCEDCISHHPSVGPVCGLCLDRITEENKELTDGENTNGRAA